MRLLSSLSHPNSKQRGFTLIEVIIVVFILGILAAIVAPQLMGRADDAKVTEAEVQDAIDRGARTLDGIKFRTRAGMGRCQGGFCSSRCMTLLAERGGVPFHAITKRGGGSWIVAEMSNQQHPRGGESGDESC